MDKIKKLEKKLIQELEKEQKEKIEIIILRQDFQTLKKSLRG